LGVLLAAPQFERTGLAPVKHTKSLAEAWAALPEGTLWLVGHRALRNVPRIAAVWDFVRESVGADVDPK
jgi:hypothetical protein